MPAPGPGFAGGMHGGGHYYAYEGDISPEDIFRAMFGFHPGMGGARTVYRRHPRRPHNGEEDEGRKFFLLQPEAKSIMHALFRAAGSGIGLLSVLPLLLLLGLSLLSFGGPRREKFDFR